MKLITNRPTDEYEQYIGSLENVHYVAYLTFAGEGCDYTPSCNRALYALNARTSAGACEELINALWGLDNKGGSLDYDDIGEDGNVTHVALMLVTQSSFNLEYYRDIARNYRAEQGQRKREAESGLVDTTENREMYQRLKELYEE